MNHDQVIELLPWLLNGTLGEGESQAVREHLATCDSCRRALDDTRLAWRVYDQHLPAEALVALAWGTGLPAGLDSAAVEGHLRSCPQCAADLELARTSRRLEEDDRIAVFPSPVVKAAPARSSASRGWRAAALAAGLAGVVAASGWIDSAGRIQTLEERLAERPPAAAPAPAPPVPVPEPAPTPVVPDGGGASEELARMAAELESLRKQAEEQSAKVRELEASRGSAGAAAPLNAYYRELRLVGDAVRGGDVAREVPAGSPSYTFTVPAEHDETHREHRVEIQDESGKRVWSAEGLRREGDEYTFVVPQPLAAGLYTVRILAPDGTKLEEARVRAQ